MTGLAIQRSGWIDAARQWTLMSSHKSTTAKDWDQKLPSWWPLALVALITVIGFILRLRMYGFPVFGDELSTIWIIRNHGFFETIKVVSTNAEITPPVYFQLAWLSMKLGSAPELVRLPALIAGTVTIPMVWRLGRRMFGNIAGLIAATLVAVSPYMVFFSAYGRAYSVMTLCVLGSTLTLLEATRTGRTRWWVIYGLTTVLAMYSHYTGAFILAGQFVWVLWAHPECRKPAFLANLGAVVLFLPWIPYAIKDNDSPTTDIMEFLQPHGFTAKIDALKDTVFSMPIHPTIFQSLKGTIVLVSFAIAAAAVFALVRYLRSKHREKLTSPRGKMVVLVMVLAFAAPVCQALLLIIGTDLLGARNLASAWPGFALALSFLFVAAGPLVGMALAIVAIFGYGVEAVKLSSQGHGFAYKQAADFINSNAEPGDVVIDAGFFTPVPLTGLDAYLDRPGREYRLLQPGGDPPFLPYTSPIKDPVAEVKEAFRKAGKADERVFAVTNKPPVAEGSERLVFQDKNGAVVPGGWEVESVQTYQGVEPQTVTVFRRTD